jgi:TRAP-type C4-dicarboxylate transport system substrate-binding protein
MKWAIWLALVLLPATAAANDVMLRLSSVAPEGSILARELKTFANEVETETQGHVKVKWYFSAVAGDELEQAQRIERGQLDGQAGGGMFCNRIIPTMKVTRLPGVFQNREEASDVMNRLKPQLDEEAHRSGFVLLAGVGLGPDVIFTRTPVHSMAELRKLKLWRWDSDEIGIATSRAMGLSVVPTSIDQAGRAYDESRSDGFVAIPIAALAFQWAAQARYVVDLRASYIWGCMTVTERAFKAIPLEHQRVMISAAARTRVRFEDVGRKTDEQLLGGLFAKVGARSVPVTPAFRSEYFAAARAAREQLGEATVPRAILDRVLQLLADHRAEREAAANGAH